MLFSPTYTETKPMKKIQQGFTLIELMIVVAIVAILAAIALPQYQNYTARAQATEALQATSGLQADIGVDYAENGAACAANVVCLGTSAATDIQASAQELEGKYFNATDVSVTATDGSIDVTFASGALTGQTMNIKPFASAAGGQIAKWECTGLTKTQHIPSGCRP
jgi:type IV pilus assembly protein PilA